MKFPPHLPPKTNNIEWHRKIQSVPWIILFILLSFFSGAVATLVVEAWIVPGVIISEPLYLAPKENTNPNTTFDPLRARHARQRLVTVFDTRQKVSEKFYRAQGKKGTAVLLSSNGWAVFYGPDYKKGEEKFWEGISEQEQTTFPVVEIVFDTVTGLVYVRFEGEGFRSMSFAPESALRTDSVLWSFVNGSWKQTNIDTVQAPDLSSARLIWQSWPTYTFSTSLPVGSVIVNANGDFVGFRGKEHGLAPGLFVENQLQEILTSSTIGYTIVPWQGYAVGFTEDENQRQGIVITDPGYPRTPHTDLRSGDVVLAINGKPIDLVTLAAGALSASEQILVSIWRGGQTIERTVSKIPFVPK